MKFLTVLIIIFLYRNWIGANPLRAAIPFAPYADWFRRNIDASHVRFLLCVGIPVVLVGWLAFEMWYWALGLPWLLLAVLVMTFAIDLVDTDALFDDHSQWLQGLSEESSLDEARQGQEDFKQLAVYEIFQSLFPALFWFLLLGPAGALAYALARQYQGGLDEADPERRLVDGVVYGLEWPAARITGFLFALVGRFGDCLDQWLDGLFDVREPIGSNLMASACAAASAEEGFESVAEFVSTSQEHNYQLKDVLQRTVYGWLGIAAIVTILGW